MTRQGLWAVGAVLVAGLAAAGVADADTGQLLLVSQGAAGAGTAASTRPDVSADGRFVAFLSRAANLTPVGTGGHAQAFVRDLKAGTVVLASAGAGGAPADADVDSVSVSDDGRRVAFHSRATNLVAGATAAGEDRSYVRDAATGTTHLVAAPTDDALRPSLSGDGTAVGFASHADYDGATGPFLKAYVRELSGGAIDLVSVGGQPVGDQPALSRTGRYVAFKGQGILGYDGLAPQVYVRDRQTGTTLLASSATGPGGAPAATQAEFPSISADGRFVAFDSAADNLSDEDAPGTTDVFERDLQAGTTVVVSRADGVAGAAGAGPGDSGSAAVSDDGREVAFASSAANLSALDAPGGSSAYVRDTTKNTTTLLSIGPGQATAPQGVVDGTGISGNGRFAVFSTNATLLTGEAPGAAVADVYRAQLAAAAPGRVGALKVKVKGRAVTVTFKPAGGAGRYVVRVRTPAGTRTRRGPGHRIVVRFGHAVRKATVTVTAVAPDGTKGRPRTATAHR